MALKAESQPRLGLSLEFVRAVQADDPHAFRFGRQEYLLRSAAGGFETAELTWDAELLSALTELRRPGRDPALPQQLGERLRRFLGAAGFGQHEVAILQAVRDHREIILSIRSAAAELFALPWELLALRATGQHLGELPGLLLRYEWPETHTLPLSHPQATSGRILFAWSASAGPVPAAQHQAALASASASGALAFDPAQDVLPHASPGQLAAVLEAAQRDRRPIAALHLLCHGTAAGGTFALSLDAQEPGGRATPVDAGQLRQLLAPHAGMLRLVVICACDSGNPGELGNQLGSAAQTLHRAGIAAVIASRYPLAIASSNLFIAKFFDALLVRPTSVEAAFVAARTSLATAGQSLDWASLQLYARAEDGDDHRPVIFRPYRGLLAFHAQHTRFFFGRDPERKEVLRKLAALQAGGESRLLVVAGASGTGKSSMVLSGAIPDLLAQGQHAPQAVDGGSWEIAVLRPGADPLGALDAALRTRQPSGRSFLLVIDQFEEIFTHVVDPALRRQFASRLWSLCRGDSGVSCILTIRVDYLGQCGEVLLDEAGLRLDRVAYEDSHRVFVAQLAARELREIIELPARKVGLELEAGLTERILADVEGAPGALPLLEYTLDLVWERRQGRVLTARTYAELGGVIGALEGKANTVIDSATPAEQKQARRILIHLVGLGEGGSADTRRRIPLIPLRRQVQSPAEEQAFDSMLQALVDARLLVRSEERSQVMVEIAHEALIRKWERLRAWVEEDRDKLVELQELNRWVAQWRSYGSLLHGAQLGYAARVLEKYADDVSPEGKQMIQASQQAEQLAQARELERARERADEQARAARRIGIAALALAVAFIAALIASGVALLKNQQARAAQERANGKAREAETSSRLAKERLLSYFEEKGRQDLFRSDPLDAILYLSQAYTEGQQGPATQVLLAAAAAGTIGPHLRSFVAHPDEVQSAAWSPNGTRIVTAGADGTAAIFIAANGQKVLTLTGHQRGVNAASFSPDGSRVVTASLDRTAKLWDARSGALLLTLTGHQGVVMSAVFSRDGKQVATCSFDKTARTWDAASGQLLRTFAGHEDQVTSIDWSPDGTQLLTGSRDKTALLWDAATGQVRVRFSGHSNSVLHVAFSPDGKHIVTSSKDRTARIVDAHSGQLRTVLQGHGGAVYTSTFTPDGDAVVTASEDRTVRVWSSDSGRLRGILAGHTQPVSSAAVSPDGTRVATASTDRTVGLWLLTNGQMERKLSGHTGTVQSVDWSPDGGRILSASNDDTARIWDAVSGQLLVSLEGHTDDVFSAVMSSDGAQVLTGSADGTARLWDASTGILVRTFAGHGDMVHSAALSRDARRVVTSSADGTARLWDAATGKVQLILRGHTKTVYSAAFVPDGSQVVTAGADRTARIWDAVSGRLLHTLTGHNSAVYYAALSPDGENIITCSEDHTARIYARASGRLLRILSGHTDAVRWAQFSPNGQLAATTGWDQTIGIWEVQSGKLLELITAHSSSIRSVHFSPDSSRIASGSEDQSVRIWNILEKRSPRQIADLTRCHLPFRLIDESVVPAERDLSACAAAASN